MKTNLKLRQIIYFLLVVILLACNPAKRDWVKTVEQNTVEAYKNYIEKYPESTFLEEAKEKYDSLDWEEIMISLDSSKLNNYIKEHDSSLYLLRAKAALDSVLWSPKQNIIDLVLIFWFNTIKPQKNEGFAVFGSLMVNSSGNADGMIKLDSSYYSQSLITRLSKYKNVKCKIELKNVVSSYEGNFTKIESSSAFVGELVGPLNHKISILNGEVELKNGDFIISSNTRVDIDGNIYEFVGETWN